MQTEETKDGNEKIVHRDYTTHGNRVLNRLIRLRHKQIAATEAGRPTTDKSLVQLRYELENMTNTLMERSFCKVSDTKG